MIVLAVVDRGMGALPNPEIGRLVQMGIGAIVALALLALWGRFVDHRPFRDYGFHPGPDWWLEFGSGFLIAALVQLAAMTSLLALGWASVGELLSPGTGGFAAGLAAAFLARFFGALWEEAVFRGACITNLAEGFHGGERPLLANTLAVLFSAAFFALVHFQQATSLAGLWLVLLLGVILGAAYVLTGQLALPLGFHFAYNFAGINVFNVVGADPAASGELARLPAVVRLEPVPEASAAAAAGLAFIHLFVALSSAALIGLWLWWRKRHRVATSERSR